MPDFTDHQLEFIKALTPIAQTLIAMCAFAIAIMQFRESLTCFKYSIGANEEFVFGRVTHRKK
jgi:hypothetical protein